MMKQRELKITGIIYLRNERVDAWHGARFDRYPFIFSRHNAIIPE